ncbi:MAG: alpha/beta hydrolase-fold protein [Saprospiraceae bacterium]|nr:alpha/beta hydrolase-fold protein [Saprospiraceae bacterium]MDW8483990.1 alpha/beta hydrolase-fold protein [Saprospiraceae bacterium]
MSAISRVMLSAFFALLCGSVSAQLTLVVKSIPANTPPGAKIYVAGNFNNWNPGDTTKILAPTGNGHYTITLNPPIGQVKYKFTRGSWATVEGNANGGYLPDRTWNYTGQPTVLELTILSWEDLGSVKSTAAPNVSILSNSFYMPQLNRYRRIWVYLPPDYSAQPQKRYPVLYMHDGQNLFDAATSFAGEWEVDETLNALHQQGDYGCIVVGIDNGGQYRLDEYSPWVNAQYNAGGQGDEYLDFIVNTLKPHIDSVFRTLPGRKTTGILGSSMGGLISMYAFSERQDVFSRAGVFSPSFWFAGTKSAEHVASRPRQGEARVYFLAGGKEPASVAQNMQIVADSLRKAGFGSDEQFFSVPADGEHREWFWRREFPHAYRWLFAGVTSSLESAEEETQALGLYPNPAGTWVRFSGVEPEEPLEVQLTDLYAGKIRTVYLRGGEALWVGDLPAGFYLLHIRAGKGLRYTFKLVRP